MTAKAGSPLLIRDARLLDAAGRVDILVRDGRIAAIGETAAGGIAASRGPGPAAGLRDTAETAGNAGVPAGTEILDADGGLVTPAFVEPHFHIDKALTHPVLSPTRQTDPLEAAIERTPLAKARYTPEDLGARGTAALELAIGHGVGTMRAHVDVDPVGGLSALRVMADLRERFRDQIDLQLAAFPQQSIVRDDRARGLLREALTAGADVLSGAPDVEAPEDRERHIDLLVDLSGEFGVPLDVHCDYGYDPGRRDLLTLSRRTVAAGLTGRVRAGHCCAMDAYDDAAAAEVAEAVRGAEIDVCVWPMGNMMLVGGREPAQGRGGVARLKWLLGHGITVSAGGDNMNDMWFPFGRLDPAEVAMVTAVAARMWSDEEIRQVFAMVTVNAARYVGAPAAGVRRGAVADLVVFSAGRLTDVLRNAPGRRTTVKRGRVVGGSESRVWTARPGGHG